MKFLNFDSVLCLSPHPDDIEFSLAGTILKYQNTKFTSVVFSTGSVHDPVTNASRWNECDVYWRNVKNIKQHFVAPLLGMYSEEEWLNLLERDFHLKQYQAIILPSQYDTHYEHRFVHYIGMAMTRISPAAIIEYKTASVLDYWIPNLFVDIKREAENKIKRLKAFVSQQKNYLQPDYMRAYHTHLTSLKKGLPVVEQFKVIGLYQ